MLTDRCAPASAASRRGADAVADLLRRAGSPRTPEYLADLDNWVSYGEVIRLWEAGAELTGDPHFARHIGEDFVGRLGGSGNSAVLRRLGSPEGLLHKIALADHRFSTAADLSAGEVREGYGEVLAVAADGFTRHRLHCEWTAGLLTQSTGSRARPTAPASTSCSPPRPSATRRASRSSTSTSTASSRSTTSTARRRRRGPVRRRRAARRVRARR